MREKNTSLRTILFETGITQRELSKRTGIHETVLSMIVNGKYIPDESQKKQIANFLNKNLEVVFK